MKKLNTVSRWLALLGSLLMIPSLILPIWRIDLFAPQYPEGLYMLIWKNKLSGDIDVINGLNHYIGMRHISEEMFPELNFIGYIIGGLIALGLITFIINKRWMLLTQSILLVSTACIALYDFYRWGYDYGHNLDDKAAIQVPGMTYQPPVLGHKKLLNFDAWSTPASGGWFIVIGGGLILAVLAYEMFFHRFKRNKLVK